MTMSALRLAMLFAAVTCVMFGCRSRHLYAVCVRNGTTTSATEVTVSFPGYSFNSGILVAGKSSSLHGLDELAPLPEQATLTWIDEATKEHCRAVVTVKALVPPNVKDLEVVLEIVGPNKVKVSFRDTGRADNGDQP